MSFYHKLWFYEPYIFATQCSRQFKLWLLLDQMKRYKLQRYREFKIWICGKASISWDIKYPTMCAFKNRTLSTLHKVSLEITLEVILKMFRLKRLDWRKKRNVFSCKMFINEFSCKMFINEFICNMFIKGAVKYLPICFAVKCLSTHLIVNWRWRKL